MIRLPAVAALTCAACSTPAPGIRPVPPPLVLEEDGGWCWFQDERALVLDTADGDLLVFGSVASGHVDPARRGDVQVTSYDLARGVRSTFELHDGLEADDHAAPALLARPDGRLIAAYARHGGDRLVRTRLSLPGDPTAWDPERTFDAGAPVTYSNLLAVGEAREGAGRIAWRVLDFHRGPGWDPGFLVSDDFGASWRQGGQLLGGPGRPYLKYAGDGRASVHFITTEQHPRDFDNGIYHGVLLAGTIRGSDGEAIAALGEREIRPEELTPIFAGRPDAVAWTVDLELDSLDRPVALFSVQRGGAGLPPGSGGLDHRYHYARWDGARWNVHEMAFAGTRLYAGEDDYTGLAAIDPDDPEVVFVSTDADPETGLPLLSAADGQRHHEIFRGETADGGQSWTWRAITRHSTADNLRPVVPRWCRERTVLLWLRGTYRSYTDYDLQVVGLILEP